jgi:hypothetical protein
MGQGLTIPKELHVSLREYEEIANDTYIVKRSSGMLDPGWIISHQSGLEPNVEGPSASKRPTKDKAKVIRGYNEPAIDETADETPVWRIFMINGKNANDYVCGWRRLETIHPARLDGDEEAITAWRKKLVEILEALELKRLEAQKAANPNVES